MTVVVITEEFDPTVDPVVELLSKRGVEVVRLDTAWFPQRVSFTGRLSGGQWHGTIDVPPRQVRVEEIRSIWFRHPGVFVFPSHLSGDEQHHALHEARIGIGGVLGSLPVLWMNHPGRQADLYKPAQLKVAAGCGLAVPETLVTNHPGAVRQFAAAHRGGVVLKQLGYASIVDDNGRRPLFTRLLDDEDFADLSGVEHTAHQFQQWIDKQYDVRLIAVGEQLFSAAIHAGSEAGRVDFRSAYDTLTYEVVETPQPVRDGVDEFMCRFDLAYGAFDFVVDHDGTWWFLECNGAGQFGFIEHHTGLPIGETIAEMLERGLS